MAYEFFVVMQARADGVVYADLHKTDERLYLFKEQAEATLKAMGEISSHFRVVKLVAVLPEEWAASVDPSEPQDSTSNLETLSQLEEEKRQAQLAAAECAAALMVINSVWRDKFLPETVAQIDKGLAAFVAMPK